MRHKLALLDAIEAVLGVEELTVREIIGRLKDRTPLTDNPVGYVSFMLNDNPRRFQRISQSNPTLYKVRESSLEGWTRVIQDLGKERAQEEVLRKETAKKLIETARALEPIGRAKLLVQALDQRVLTLNEFLVEIRDTVGLEPLE